MTTIVFNKGELAADLLVGGSTIYGSVSKLRTFKDKKGRVLCAAGMSGTLGSAFEWLTEFERVGPNRKKLPSIKEDNVAIIASKDKFVWLVEESGWFQYTAPFYAIGSGSDYALGAMEMGASAKRAIEVASKFDQNTGHGVEVIKVW